MAFRAFRVCAKYCRESFAGAWLASFQVDSRPQPIFSLQVSLQYGFHHGVLSAEKEHPQGLEACQCKDIHEYKQT